MDESQDVRFRSISQPKWRAKDVHSTFVPAPSQSGMPKMFTQLGTFVPAASESGVPKMFTQLGTFVPAPSQSGVPKLFTQLGTFVPAPSAKVVHTTFILAPSQNSSHKLVPHTNSQVLKQIGNLKTQLDYPLLTVVICRQSDLSVLILYGLIGTFLGDSPHLSLCTYLSVDAPINLCSYNCNDVSLFRITISTM